MAKHVSPDDVLVGKRVRSTTSLYEAGPAEKARRQKKTSGMGVVIKLFGAKVLLATRAQ